MDKDKLREILSQHKLWLSNGGGKRADLYRADLRGADLYGADLRGAFMREADLRGATLYKADLYEADLYGANMRGAFMREANMFGAELRGADLLGADLYEAKIDELVKTRFYPLACPETGAFVGWKKCENDVIVKLLIPEDAKRSSAYGRKCRCSKVITLAVFGGNGKTAKSVYDHDVIYEVGKETLPAKPFNEDRWDECASGIHFFITRKEAEDFNL